MAILTTILIIGGALVAYLALNFWILPALGVPT